MVTAIMNIPAFTKLLLCQAGLEDKNGMTALMHAIQNHTTEAVKRLVSFEKEHVTSKMTSLIQAVIFDFKTVSINSFKIGFRKQINGKSALMHAALNCKLECI